MAQVSDAKLTELIVDFYTENDPERLRKGVDINGMVKWTQANGIAKLNRMLMEQYGEALDMNKNLGSAVQQFNRMSMAFIDKNVLQNEEAKRDEIYVKLYAFYERYEPNKLAGIQKIVDFAMFKGVDVLNQKLMIKYGEDLGTDFKYQVVSGGGTGPAAPPKMPKGVKKKKKKKDPPPVPKKMVPATPERSLPPVPAPKPAPMDAPAPSLDMDSLPPPPSAEEAEASMIADGLIPPPPPIEDFVDEDTIEDELKRFYGKYDPGKLEALDYIVAFATGLGRIEFNKKLLQLYGANLDDLEPEDDVEDDYEEPAVVITPAPVVKSKPPKPSSRPPKPSQPALVPKSNPPKPSSRAPKPSQPAPKPSAPAPAPKPSAPAPVPAPAPVVNSKQGDGACDNFQLDMSGSSFGVCMCGHLKAEHNTGGGGRQRQNSRNEARRPSRNEARRPSRQDSRRPSHQDSRRPSHQDSHKQSRRPSRNEEAYKPPKPIITKAPKPSAPPPGMSGSSSKPPKPSARPPGGSSKPPKPRAPAPVGRSGSKPAPVKATGSSGNISAACDNYRLDMTGTSFGICVCGQPRAAHTNRKPNGGGVSASQSNFGRKRSMNQYQPPELVPASIPSVSVNSFANTAGGGGGGGNGPCDNYTLDMTGASFGVCTCGYSRSDHNRKMY